MLTNHHIAKNCGIVKMFGNILLLDVYGALDDEATTTLMATPHLLPLRLVGQWSQLPLPAWVSECCGLPTNSTIAHLATVPMPSDAAARAAVEFFVTEFVKGHAKDILEVPLFQAGLTVSRDLLSSVGCKPRAINALQLAGMFESPERLYAVTFGQIYRIPAIGIKTVLNIAVCLDAIARGQSAIRSPAKADPGVIADSGNLHSESKSSRAHVPTAGTERVRQSLEELVDSDWADSVFPTDMRFRDLLPLNGDSVALNAGAILAALNSPDAFDGQQLLFPSILAVDPTDISAVSDWLAELDKRASRIKGLFLEELLSEYLQIHTDLAGSRLTSILARLGWSGKPPITLDRAGRLLGVTRERLRQIEEKVKRRLPTGPAFVPALSKAIAVLAEAAPIELGKAAEMLREKRISRNAFTPESVIAAANDLAVDVPLMIASVKGLRMVISAAKSANMPLIIKISRKRAGASGVVNSVDVAARVALAAGTDCTSDEVSEILSSSPRFRRLLQDWFWATDLPAGRNRLVNVCRKMLSITCPISLARLRDGVRREYKFRNITSPSRYDLQVPPANVMRAFLSDHPEFVVVDDLVHPAVPLDYRREMGEFDRLLVDVLRSSPSAVLDRATIVRECLRRGAQPARVQTELTYSCVVEHVDINIWSLRGADINPAAVEALRKANALRPKEVRVRNFGWTPDGELWIASAIPDATQPTVIGCPAGTTDFLAGQKFVAFTQDDVPCGTIGVTEEGTAYGFGPFQRMTGGDPGDILVVEFDLQERKATLLLGSEELLESYGPE